MNPFNSNKEQPGDYFPEPTPKKSSPLKAVGIVVGGLFAVAHVGLLGYLMQETKPDYPVINFPSGDYSSYEVEANKDGYKIKYKANDPAILESDRSLELDKNKRGLFGPTTEMRREFRRDQYTMDGVRNIGGSVSDAEGKNLAKTEECIRADAGARSQGAMAGTAISAGLVVPAVSSIPYIGWLAGGWALLLGQQAGESIGAEVGSAFNDC
ncbi:hypothetical protein SWYG_00129 [Synechococcus phage S-IOM18]|jgi:hypothetical protein|uniref:Gp163 n=1 Tax=Synechococcus phage S-IOM18 TaxID=754039 RepID=R9TQ70_9CAUD|nr:hypothetical protein SWYG_00129 [Synechococcus phage S-IOM18]AGN33639.1 hypothetical protein SWYG_00129 [Synechococcus phage S-IOM18]